MQPVQKKVLKVWKPKKVVCAPAPVAVNTPEVTDTVVGNEATPVAHNDQGVSVKDDGWRVVSRRRR